MSERRGFDRKIAAFRGLTGAASAVPMITSVTVRVSPGRKGRQIMKRHTIAVSLGALLFTGLMLAPPARAHEAKAATAPTMSATDLRNGMRKLWTDHTTYTRSYIVSALAGLPDLPTVTQRLLRNQDDIGNAIKPIYGEEAGKKLAALLRDHILIAAEIVKAAKASDAKGVDAGQKKWKGNADDIAAFLSGANPQWKKPALTDMLHKHLDFVTQQVVSRIKMDWPADIQAYDAGFDHMMMFADMLSDGIIKQNPKKIIHISEK
jgi:hypothetical protein